jgi:hypothetical protein
MYMEDVDLCRRIGAVADTVFYPGVAIHHEYDKGSYRNPLLRKYHLQSAWRYFNKWGWLIDSGRSRLNRRVAEPVRYRPVKTTPLSERLIHPNADARVQFLR